MNAPTKPHIPTQDLASSTTALLTGLSIAQKLVLRTLNDLCSQIPGGKGVNVAYLTLRLNTLAGQQLFTPAALNTCLHDLKKLELAVIHYPQGQPTWPEGQQPTKRQQEKISKEVLWQPAGHIRNLIALLNP